MPDLVDDLAAQGRALPPNERVRLLDLLLESLQPPSLDDRENAWNDEIARRVDAHERGEGKLYDVGEVIADAERLAP